MTRLHLSLSAMVLGVVLTGFHRDSTGIGGECEAAFAANDREFAIRPIDTAGMRTLLGRHGGRRRPLALYLFYTDCQPCTDRLSDIERLYDEYRDKGLDVALVSIAPMDNRRKLLDLVGDLNPQIPTFLLEKLDDDFAEEFFLRDWEPVVPSVFFYNPRGKLEYSETDAKSITFPSLQRHAEKLLRRLHKNSRTPELGTL